MTVVRPGSETNGKTLDVRVELWDDDGFGPNDQIDVRTSAVEYEPTEVESSPTDTVDPSPEQTSTDSPTESPTEWRYSEEYPGDYSR